MKHGQSVHLGWKWRKTGTVREGVPGWQGVKAQAWLQVPRVHHTQTRCAADEKGVCMWTDRSDPRVSLNCASHKEIF